MVKPLHKAFLQPRYAFPVGLRTVWEIEVSEERFKIEFVVVRYVPEHSLIVSCACWLVERVDNLLEEVGYNLVDGALFQAQVHHLFGVLPVVFAVFLLYEVVHIHQKLGCCARSCQHTRYHEHHIDEASAEAFKVGRCGRVATNRRCAADEPRVHSNRSAVVSKVGFVVLIYKVVCKQVQIFVGKFLAVHSLDAVGKQTAVQTNETLLWKFANKGGNVLVFHVGIGVKLRAGGCILCVAVVCKEAHLLQYLAVFGVLVAINDEAFSHVVVSFLHQSLFYLVLDVLYFYVVVNLNVRENFRNCAEVGGFAYAVECLYDGIHNFVERETVFRAVAFGDGEILHFSFLVYPFLLLLLIVALLYPCF